MKIYVLAAAALSLSSVASASDLPSKKAAKAPAPIAQSQVQNWTGFYAGVHAGYSWLNSNSAYDINSPGGYYPSDMSQFDINLKPSGFIGGGQIGFNYQLDNNVVVGVEGKVSYLDLKDTKADELSQYFNPSSTDTISSKINSEGMIAAKLGYAFGSTLPYITGGYAWAKSDYSDTQGPHSISKTLQGWAVGAGIEHKLTQNISVKAEYLHVMFEKQTYFSGESYQGTSKPDQDTVLVGLNYHF